MPTPQRDPVLQSVMPAPPAALRTFPQTDTVAVYAEASDRDATPRGTVTMSTTVADGAGKVVFKNAGVLPSEPQADPAKTSFVVRVPMNDLPPGSYLLTATARSQAADVPPATQQVPFTVVSAPVTSTTSEAPAAPVPTAGPCCPDQGSYKEDVRAFAYGDRVTASIAIARAPAGQLKHAVASLSGDDEKLLEAAAVMHLVLGSRSIRAAACRVRR